MIMTAKYFMASYYINRRYLHSPEAAANWDPEVRAALLKIGRVPADLSTLAAPPSVPILSSPNIGASGPAPHGQLVHPAPPPSSSMTFEDVQRRHAMRGYPLPAANIHPLSGQLQPSLLTASPLASLLGDRSLSRQPLLPLSLGDSFSRPPTLPSSQVANEDSNDVYNSSGRVSRDESSTDKRVEAEIKELTQRSKGLLSRHQELQQVCSCFSTLHNNEVWGSSIISLNTRHKSLL